MKSPLNEGNRDTFLWRFAVLMLAHVALIAASSHAQFDSGSTGADGAFMPTQDVTIDMSDHPDGIYHYTEVRIPIGVTVRFIPNSANTPVRWLVEGECVIEGTVNIDGGNGILDRPASGGPGGFRGGFGGDPVPGPGMGPGGGKVVANFTGSGGYASYGSAAEENAQRHPSGFPYGNIFLLPLLGGSGGGGGTGDATSSNLGGSGGGGGGAILIAAKNILLSGEISSRGGNAGGNGGFGSGGAIRLVCSGLVGTGQAATDGTGKGRIRIESITNLFGGQLLGTFTSGSPGVLILPQSTRPSIRIGSIGGVAVGVNPRGRLEEPDLILPETVSNPVSVVLELQNIPLGTDITLEAKPRSGASVVVIAQNTSGTDLDSSASFSIDLPEDGILEARAITNISVAKGVSGGENKVSLLKTGLSPTGEPFSRIEVASALGNAQRLVYITESGGRFTLDGAN